VHEIIRERVPTLDGDRPPSPDLAVITDLIASGELERAIGFIVN
jgi:histidine ammonia-lyase